MRWTVLGLMAAVAVEAGLHTWTPATAQTPAPASTAPAPPQKDYRPGLGDLMLLIVQPRHVKLGLAGREGNWPLAAFSLNELKAALTKAGLHQPRWRNGFPIPETTNALMSGPVTANLHVRNRASARGVEHFHRRYNVARSGGYDARNDFELIPAPVSVGAGANRQIEKAARARSQRHAGLAERGSVDRPEGKRDVARAGREPPSTRSGSPPKRLSSPGSLKVAPCRHSTL